MSTSNNNPLAMSDEDFLKLNGPAESSDADDGQSEPTEEENEGDQGADEDGDAAAEGESDTGADGDEEDEGASSEAEGDEGKGDDDQDGKSDDQKADATSEGDALGEGEAKSAKDQKADPASAEELDYKTLYQQVMAPFKANGKTFTPQSVEEVIQLAQMGANYTKKLQDIQPHRKVLLMLQNHDLLDEGKLSYLIDLDKKNPEAIKKLLKDSGIDPLDIDTASDPDYTEGAHKVTDSEARFHEVLEDVSSRDSGKETITVVNTTWDEASKEVIWNQPEVLSVIHEQRTNGIYDLIVAEMDRQKTLGKIPTTTPFLQAYKQVGDALAQAGAFGSVTQQNGAPAKPEPQKIDERAAVPKPKAANGDKAKSASATRGSSSQSKQPLVNPLAMSDEEFLKMDALRNRL